MCRFAKCYPVKLGEALPWRLCPAAFARRLSRWDARLGGASLKWAKAQQSWRFLAILCPHARGYSSGARKCADWCCHHAWNEKSKIRPSRARNFLQWRVFGLGKASPLYYPSRKMISTSDLSNPIELGRFTACRSAADRSPENLKKPLQLPDVASMFG
jgi:hypothetical protein